ncbi:MAG: spore cortex-lytic enzyme, partial [Syntrophomonadaceae bacterium]|nr:spore cortex-lytic enzyme [Syntrophomonadaceae bacterium]
CNYYQGELDGIFGPLTEQAVQEFQEAKAIEVDGIVGPETFFMVGMSMA